MRAISKMSCKGIREQSAGAKHFYPNGGFGIVSCVTPDTVKLICNLNPSDVKARKKRDKFLLQKSQENLLKRNENFLQQEIKAMLPFKKFESELCDPIKICETGSGTHFIIWLLVCL